MNRDFPIKDIGMERDFWAKIKGGGFKNVKKLKKKLQNDKEKGKKRKKWQKIEKNDAKSRAICDVFSKSDKISVQAAEDRKFGIGRNCLLKMGVSKELKWVRWVK